MRVKLSVNNENPSITTKTTSFTISGMKIVVCDLEGKWREEININHISHVRCDSEATNYRTMGGVLIVLGILSFFVLSYQRIFIYYSNILLWSGAILVLIGIALFLIKSSKSTMIITLTGVEQPLKYQLEDVTNRQIQEFITKILPMH